MSTSGSRALTLKPLQVAGFHGSISLSAEHLRLGRAEDNDVVLTGDDFPSVSTHHAQLEWRGDRLWVRDLGSKNGTVVNGEAVEEAALGAGDVLRLGPVGPRFLVAAQGRLEETAFVDASKVRPELAAAGRSEARLRRLVETRSRRVLALVLGATLLLGGGLALTEWRLARQRQALDLERAGALAEELARSQEVVEELSRRQAQKDQEYAAIEVSRETQEAARREEIERLRASRDELSQRLAQVEGEGQVGRTNQEQIASLREELVGTRSELEEARRQVDLFDPVNLEASRLSQVARVREAVVLIESQTELVHAPSGAVLHVEEGPDGPEPNFEDRGEVWTIDSTGSGFCVSAQGWILTNAHVVALPQDDPLLRRLGSVPIVPRQRYFAVFSGSSVRHEARVERVAREDVDLALMHIEPFEGMPYLPGLELDVPTPPTGSDVFLFGFPLGNFALQEGERVIASTFRGILSRQVDGNLQVDAGVHPGNSGGPITDSAGRVVGVVFSVQAMPDRTAVFTIGYGIPIRDAADLWPPPSAPTKPFGFPTTSAIAKPPGPVDDSPVRSPGADSDLPAGSGDPGGDQRR